MGVSNTTEVDNTIVSAQALSEQEILCAQIVDDRKEIDELTEDELKEVEKKISQFEKGS